MFSDVYLWLGGRETPRGMDAGARGRPLSKPLRSGVYSSVILVFHAKEGITIFFKLAVVKLNVTVLSVQSRGTCSSVNVTQLATTCAENFTRHEKKSKYVNVRGLFKKYAGCLKCAARVGFRRIRLVSLGSYRSAD